MSRGPTARRAARAVVLPGLAATLVALAVPATATHAQGWMGRVKAAATEAATRKAEGAARSGAEQAVDAATATADAAVGSLTGGRVGTAV